MTLLIISIPQIIKIKIKLVDGEVAYEFPCDGLLNKDLLWDKLKQYNPDIAVILEEVKEDHLAQVKAAVEKRFV